MTVWRDIEAASAILALPLGFYGYVHGTKFAEHPSMASVRRAVATSCIARTLVLVLFPIALCLALVTVTCMLGPFRFLFIFPAAYGIPFGLSATGAYDNLLHR